jgi:hypothetical protein
MTVASIKYQRRMLQMSVTSISCISYRHRSNVLVTALIDAGHSYWFRRISPKQVHCCSTISKINSQPLFLYLMLPSIPRHGTPPGRRWYPVGGRKVDRSSLILPAFHLLPSLSQILPYTTNPLSLPTEEHPGTTNESPVTGSNSRIWPEE